MRVHYSLLPLRAVDDRRDQQRHFMKPNGLWYSPEDEYSWKEYYFSQCKGCGREGDFACCAELDIDMSKILIIDTAEKMEAFIAEYQLNRMAVDWPRVAEKWSGIEISPHRWDFRMNCGWYYSWDCASGCIWDPSVVTLKGVRDKTARKRAAAAATVAG